MKGEKRTKITTLLIGILLLISITTTIAEEHADNKPNKEQPVEEENKEQIEEENGEEESTEEQQNNEENDKSNDEEIVNEEIYIPIENLEEENKETKKEEQEDKNNEREINEEDYVDKETLQEILEDIDNNADYVDIDTFIEEKEKEKNEEENNTEKEEQTTRIEKKLIKNGELELEYEISSDEYRDITIEKKEILINNKEKWVTISSKEHFNNELRAYSDLPRPAKIEDIKIYWENEQEEVTKGIIYFDENSDGNITRVSWPIPHLSTQLYSIHIEIDDAGTTSTSIGISVISPPNNTDAQNPINFNFSIDYHNVTAIECDLTLTLSNGTTIGFLLITEELDVDVSNTNLGGEELDWSLYCEDKNNNSINETILGHFNIENDLNLNMNYNHYWKGDGIGYSINANGGTTYLDLKRPAGDTVHPTGFTGTSTTGNIPTGTAGGIGTYTLTAINDYFDNNVTDSENFTVGDIELEYDDNVQEDEEITLKATIHTPESGTIYYYIDGDLIGTQNFNANMNGEEKELNYTPSTEGTYEVKLTIDATGLPNKTKTFGNLNVESGGDTQDPDINLEFPEWQEEIGSSVIEFVYSVSDNEEINNCSLAIYNTTESDSGVYETGDLLFPTNNNDKTIAEKHDDFTNNEDIKVKLIEFDDGPYIWEIECFDKSHNRGWDFNYFEVNTNGTRTTTTNSNSELNDYERKGEVDSLINSINNFLEKQGSFTPEQEIIAELLGIKKATNSYKKKLLQIDQDLGYNLDFMEEEKREIRIQEINQEIDQIKEDLVSDITIKKSYEYSKTSTDKTIEELITTYLEQTNTNIKSKEQKNMITLNEELQKNLNTQVFVWRIELSKEGIEDLQELIIIKKELDIKGGFKGEILEFLDSSFDLPEFITPTKDLGGGIYEFYEEDLEDNSIIYYFDDSFELEELETTETILFEENINEKTIGTTGFAVAFSEGFNFSWLAIILGILLTGYVGFYITGKVRTKQMLTKAPGASVIAELIEQTKKQLKEKKIDGARDNYYKMNETYKALDPKTQAHFYKEIKNIRTEINKKDILKIVKEYEKAKEEYRKEDAETLYARISELYKILPKKYQEKIYKRITKR